MKKAKILIADDYEPLRNLLTKELSRAGYVVDTAKDGEEALNRVREDAYNVILLDIVMPKINGVEVLRKIKEEKITAEVIMLTGNGTIESAIECMRLGALDYIRKPCEPKELIIQIEKAIEHESSTIERNFLKQQIRKNAYGGEIIGKSKEIVELRSLIAKIAPTQSSVIVYGESGTGKELVARAIHEQSNNSNMQFIAVNCASIPENLIESELFGYEKGAFTDAKTQKRGLAEVADGGTLFLDEIGELPLHFQPKLLRFLETGEIRRIGGTKNISLNVRIICATNKDLEKLVEQKLFREDLYYRLNVLNIYVPPLRKRKEDIPLIVENIIKNQNFTSKFDQSAIDILLEYDWPGNIRELKNVIERVCVLYPNHVITAKELSFLKISEPQNEVVKVKEDIKPYNENLVSLRELERLHIINVLKQVKGHKGKAAKILKINPKTLYRKIKEYNIIQTFE
jgi:DNA-binding NtrC family response regulator